MRVFGDLRESVALWGRIEQAEDQNYQNLKDMTDRTAQTVNHLLFWGFEVYDFGISYK